MEEGRETDGERNRRSCSTLLGQRSWLCFLCQHYSKWASQVVLVVENPPANASLGREDPLEEGMANHSSTAAWRIPWTEEPGRLHTVHSVAESDTTEAT